jgi:ribonuclease P protein component
VYPSKTDAGVASPHAFPRERRLRKRRDFLRIQSQSRRVVTPHFVLLIAHQPLRHGAPARLGLVVTRKVGNAVVRNRIKRLCRECFRRWVDLLPVGVDLVVIARAGAGALGLAAVQAEWARVGPQLRRSSQEALAQGGSRTHASPTTPKTPAPPKT